MNNPLLSNNISIHFLGLFSSSVDTYSIFPLWYLAITFFSLTSVLYFILLFHSNIFNMFRLTDNLLVFIFCLYDNVLYFGILRYNEFYIEFVLVNKWSYTFKSTLLTQFSIIRNTNFIFILSFYRWVERLSFIDHCHQSG